MKLRLNIKLILLTLCIAVPVTAVITFMGIRSNDTQRRQILAESQAEVQGTMSQIDTVLELLEHALAFMSVDDTQIRSIALAQERTTGFWLDNHEVMEKLQYQTMISGLNMTPFIYYPGQDIFYNSEQTPAVTQVIKQQMDENRFPNNTAVWQIISCEGQHWLYLVFNYSDYYVGAFGSCSDFYEGLPGSETEQYIFTDTEGNCLSRFRETQIDLGQELITLDQDSWYQLHAASAETELYLVRLIRKAAVDSQMISIVSYVLIIAVIFAVLLATYIICLRFWILKPMNHLRQSMETIRQGDLDHRIPELPGAGTEFGSVAEEFNRLMDHIEELKISIYEKDLEQKEVRLEYLNRQIQPHFILNSLNTLYNYSESDKDVTQKMIRLISGYYRYVVNVNSQFVELGQELDHIDHYMELQMLRYPGLFTYEISCSREIGIFPIPPFIIESFIGNIFKHGLTPGEGNQIGIRITGDLEQICIRIEDTGPGFSEDSLDAVKEFLEDGIISEELGVGIRNSIERLQLIYKDRFRIRFFNKEEGGSVVEIEVCDMSGTAAE